jgi:hypothetical protein
VTLPVEGLPLHTRSLTVTVSQREDARWRVLGQVIDLRKSSFVPMVDDIQTAGLIHHMTLDAVVDPATRVLAALDTEQRAVAVEVSPRTRGESCRDPAPRLQALVGLPIDEGFDAELSRVFGGPRGCSHLLTLFHLLVSALPRALALESEAGWGAARRPGEKLFRRSVFLDGTEPGEGRLQLAVQLSDFFTRPLSRVKEPLDHLVRQDEVRAVASVALEGLAIQELVARQRTRTRETLGTAGWSDLGPELAQLRGRPIMPGLGKELRRRLGPRPELRLLLDALVQLAPGFVQCMPALSDRMLSRFAAAGPASLSADAPRPPLPAFLAFGGAADSCYMWRREGPLLEIRGRS